MQSRLTLTKAQEAILRECAYDPRGITGCVSSYAPAKIVVSRGLARWLDGDPMSERLIITPAGRAALAKEGK